MSGDLAGRLAALISARTGEPVEVIADLRRAPAGLSQETWLFAVVRGQHREELVLRMEAPGGGGLIQSDRQVELRLLKALEGSPVPAPVVAFADLAGEQLGRPAIVMRRAAGSCDYFVLNGELPLAERRELAEAFCRLLADVHLVDWSGLGMDAYLTDPGPMASLVALDWWSEVLASRGPGAYPELAAVERWLRATAPPSSRTVLVHGDFKPGNVLMSEGRISALLDWETAHLGDPLEDLGWVTQPMRSKEHLIEGHWDRGDLVGCYQRLTGTAVDGRQLAWWQSFASYKTAVIQLCGLAAYLTGRGSRLFREPADYLRLLIDQMEREWLRPAVAGRSPGSANRAGI